MFRQFHTGSAWQAEEGRCQQCSALPVCLRYFPEWNLRPCRNGLRKSEPVLRLPGIYPGTWRRKVRRYSISPGVEFDYNSSIQKRPVGRIGLIGIIGMDGMGIISRNHKAVRKVHQIILFCHSQTTICSGQGVVQEGGCGSLFCIASGFLIVQDTVNSKVRFSGSGQKAFQRSKGTLPGHPVWDWKYTPEKHPRCSLFAGYTKTDHAPESRFPLHRQRQQ